MVRKKLSATRKRKWEIGREGPPDCLTRLRNLAINSKLLAEIELVTNLHTIAITN